MSNKKKTLFQQYLDSKKFINKNIIDNIMGVERDTGMSDEVRLSYTKKFYGNNLEGFHEVESENGRKMFKGRSKDGFCTVTEQGGLYCETTGRIATPVDFILTQNNNLTTYGANYRYFSSIIETVDPINGIYHSILEKNPLMDMIETSRTGYISDENLNSFGLKKSIAEKHPIWFDGHQKFFYVYFNKLNYPVCKHEWRFDGDQYDESIFGVPSLNESSQADRIIFVENPMQLVSLSEKHSEPIYVRPNAYNYLYHDFSRIIQGKEVVCVKAHNTRNADSKNLDFTFLESDDPLELLYTYDQGLPQESTLSEDDLKNMLSDIMDKALDSIESYLKFNGNNQ